MTIPGTGAYAARMTEGGTVVEAATVPSPLPGMSSRQLATALRALAKPGPVYPPPAGVDPRLMIKTGLLPGIAVTMPDGRVVAGRPDGTVHVLGAPAPSFDPPPGAQVIQAMPDGSSVVLPLPQNVPGADDAPTVNAAALALGGAPPSGVGIGVPGQGIVRLGPYQYTFRSTASLPPGVILQGSGPGTVINSFVNGDCIFQQNPTQKFGGGPPLFGNVFQGYSGGVRDLLIDGTNAGANGCGLHVDSMPERLIIDGVIIQNFTGANAIGLHLSNSITFTETFRIRAFTTNCTLGCMMEKINNGGTLTGSESFRYGDFWLHVVAEQGQSGMVMQGVSVHLGNFRLTGNYAASTAAGPANWSHLYLTPAGIGSPGPTYAQLRNSNLMIVAEIDLPNPPNSFTPQSIICGGVNNPITNNYGNIQFLLGTGNAFVPANLNGAAFSLWGMVGGDSVLQAANAQPGQVFLNGIVTTPPAVTTPGVPASTVAVTNNTGVDVMVYLSGAWTLTAATQIGGTALGDTATRQWYLPASQTIKLTYSAAGGWQWAGI